MKNTSRRKVRKHQSSRLQQDRRVRRTRQSAHEALIGLAREKPYDSIAIQDILNRADIARSTFYTHFGNKNEVLESGIHELVRLIGQPSNGEAGVERVVGFSLPFLEHIAGHRQGAGAHMPHGSRIVFHERLQTILADSIANDLKATRRAAMKSVPADLLGRHIASTFVLVLNWWLECEPSMTPAQADARFRRLVLPLLADV